MNKTIKIVTDPSKIANLRTLQKDAFKKKYKGWCNKFDAKFDPYSTWFCLYDEVGEIDGFVRITEKSDELGLPIEEGTGFFAEPNSYEVNNYQMFGSLTHKFKNGLLMMDYVFRYIQGRGVGLLYSVVDQQESSHYTRNVDIFKFQDIERTIQFSTILHEEDEESVVDWQLLLQSAQDRAAGIVTIQNYRGFPKGQGL